MTKQQLIFICIQTAILNWYFHKSGYFNWIVESVERRKNRGNQHYDPRYHYIKFERFVDRKPRPTTLQVYQEDFRLLVAMCHDQQRAEDLIVDLVLTYPGQKGRWYVEKAIWDLERDRK